ncbi:MAG TPA: DUF2127 domain-containing protein [Candidatus Saccharimonadales bacterium]|nr:DUF2127 domain-containing protein [Candidatus Saccharimonadales bacterium]
MAVFHAKTKLDRAFEISLLLKGLDGLLETLSGIAFLFIKPAWVVDLAHAIVGYHPTGFIGEHILTSAQHFGHGTAIFASLYLLSHGLVKLVLVVEILREHLWAYIGLIVVTGGFIIYQLYHIFFKHPSISFIALTIFDVIVVYLTVREYGHQKERLGKKHAAEKGESASAD